MCSSACFSFSSRFAPASATRSSKVASADAGLRGGADAGAGRGGRLGARRTAAARRQGAARRRRPSAARAGPTAMARRGRGPPSFSARQRLVGRRQVGGMGDADEHHVGGGERLRRLLRLLDALRAASARRGRGRGAESFVGEILAARLLLLGQRIVVDRGRRELEPRDDVGEGGEVLEHDRRVGADVVEPP